MISLYFYNNTDANPVFNIGNLTCINKDQH